MSRVRMSRIRELEEKVLRGEVLGKMEKCELALICIQRGDRDFSEVPVKWKPTLGGPLFVVGRSGDIRILVEINVKGKELPEIISTGHRALAAAKRMYEEMMYGSENTTSRASMVASEDFEAVEIEQIPYVPTELEFYEAARECVEGFWEGFEG